MSTLGIFGVDYKSASLDVRERLTFLKKDIPATLKKLHNYGLAREAVILSTCNRTEIYCVSPNIELVINAIGEIKNICPKTVISKHAYIYTEVEAVKHLFRVTSGLESMILGETEIVSQVKDAIFIAKESGMLSRQLSGLFQIALSVEKDVRSSTDINSIAVSYGNAVLKIIYQHFSDLSNESILFIGAGNMMRSIAPYFKNINCRRKTIVNRTLAKAEELASKIGGNGLGLKYLASEIENYNIIVICCYSNTPILELGLLDNLLKQSNQLLIMDLSVPLVSDSHFSLNKSVRFFTIDDIARVISICKHKKAQKLLLANQIIEKRLLDYEKWMRKRELSPIIRALRDNAEEIRLQVLSDAKRQLISGQNNEEVLTELSIKLMNKLIHAPTVNLCSRNLETQDELMNLLCDLYNLKVEN